MNGNLPAIAGSQASSSSSPIVIAGMHRSGTSLIASLLSSLGVRLGDRLVPPDRNNPRGYFEDTEILALNREMLAAATVGNDGGHPDWGWTETGLLNRERYDSFRERAGALVEARTLASAGSTWGWKDPRTTLALEFWDSIVPSAHYVLVYRHPWEVADSMQRLGADVFLRRPDYAWKIWRFYNSHLLEFYRQHKDRALLVSANAARLNPERLLELLEARLGLDGSRRNGTIVDPDLFQGTGKDDPLPALAALAHRDSANLLTELDRAADLSGGSLWSRRLSPLHSLQSKQAAPRVSIILPCFNHGEYLIDAVASAERSIEEPCELIIVNDGSDEPRTLEVLDLLRETGYHVLDQENLGLSAARNRGIEKARSPYILPLDADNRLRPGFVTSALAILEAHPEVGVVYGDRRDFGMRNASIRVSTFDADALLQCNFIDACALMRKEVWSACGGYDTALSAWEDWDLWIGATKRGWQFHHLPGEAFDYRVRPNSIIGLSTEEQHREVNSYVVAKHHDLYQSRLPQILVTAQRATAELFCLIIDHEQAKTEHKADAEQTKQKDKELAALDALARNNVKHITQLQQDLEERSAQAAHFQGEIEQQSRLLDRLKNQLEASDERLARARDELLDARWETLTLRGSLLGKTDSAETPLSRILELENRVETTTSERDHLRGMLASLQNDLEHERQARQGELAALQAQLTAATKDLRAEQKQMDRLRESLSRKLILPFGRSQRKLQQLTTNRRADT